MDKSSPPKDNICLLCSRVVSTVKPQVIIMRLITVIGALLVLSVGVVVADAQGIGYGPGANPSNPQDLIGRSNPQDLTAPGGSNRQDLVRRSPGATSIVTSPSRTTAPRYTKKAKAKPKPRHSTEPR